MTRRWIIAIAVVGALLRLGLALRDLDTVDRLFVPDDTYYTLAIARSLAAGDGPTADGVTLTSGFQPLIAFLTVPVFWLTDDADVPIRLVLILCALADALVIVALGLLARRLGGERAGPIAAALWAASPVAIGNALGGLETSLALAAQLWLVVAWCRLREAPSLRRELACGALAGLVLLARIDGVFVVGALGLLELARRDVRRVARIAGMALLVVAPWWLYELRTFGSVVPESGAAVRDVVAMHHALYLRTSMQVGWASGTVLGGPVWDAAPLRDYLFAHAGAAWGAFAAILLLGGLAARRFLALRDARAPIAMFALHALAVLLLYTFAVPALWFFPRYLAPVEALVTLLLAAALAHSRVTQAIAAAAIAVAMLASARWLVTTPASTEAVGLHGAKGYRVAAREVFALVPPGSVVAAFQSGALAYFAPPGVRVVNLDGVVDGHAAEAGRAQHLAAYARARDVTHLADWQFNLDNFVRLSQREELPQTKLLGTASPQGPDRFAVFALRWRR